MAKTTRRRTTTTKKASEKKVSETSEASKPTKSNEFLGLALKPWVAGARKAKLAETRGGKRGFVIAIGHRETKALKTLLSGHLAKWQLDLALASDAESQSFQGSQGPIWILRAPQATNKEAAEMSHESLEKSGFARFRDLAGAIVPQLGTYKLEKLICDLHEMSEEEELGFLVGLEIASYSFNENRGVQGRRRKKLPQLLVKSASETLDTSVIQAAGRLALSVNLARHLTNIPGGELNPETYAEAVQGLFAGSPTVTVDVWEGEKLKEERMNLLLAVGQGAQVGPRFVHLRYRPEGVPEGQKPLAIVGKGVTFDSGGLDIKPSSSMRLMKKDMGGSAAAVALMKWAESSELNLPLDVYLSLAENAVSGNSLRPGDVVVARSGLSIEIHNTDAEGRLVLADAFDVAVSQSGDDAPMALIDIATLTGAIKVGLGAEIAGLFSNNDDLAYDLADSGRLRGDLMWRMPLYHPYKSNLRSTFADHVNAADGFGGAITAALFLELFVKKVPWAHLDVYAWKDSASGAWTEAGGSGQPVLALAEVLARLEASLYAHERV